MEFPADGRANAGSTSLLDAGFAADLSALAVMPRAGGGLVDWDAGLDLSIPPPGTTHCNGYAAAPAHAVSCPQPMRFSATNWSSGIGPPTPGLASPLHTSRDAALSSEASYNASRAARNGREQQRAQRISDLIDKLKGMLDRANVAGESSSKLHVLTSCENYLRSLQNRVRCYELERKLKSAAAGNVRTGGSGDDDSHSDGGSAGGGKSPRSNSSREGSSNGSNEGASAYGVSPPPPLNPSDGGGGGSMTSDNDLASSSGGVLSTSDGLTDSAADQSSTTETASRGFTTDVSRYGDSSLGAESGSVDSSGDVGSRDAGSADEDSDGGSRARLRVVDYFDIFRLSNVPMAIASKDGKLVDVNDAMRGFGRMDQEAVKSMTVKSLVAPESAQALEQAMSEMLASSNSSTGASRAAQQQQQQQQQEEDERDEQEQEQKQKQEQKQPLQPPFFASAKIGDRPTLLTVSLVYDEQGEPNAFHVALIPRSHSVAPGLGVHLETELEGKPPQGRSCLPDDRNRGACKRGRSEWQNGGAEDAKHAKVAVDTALNA